MKLTVFVGAIMIAALAACGGSSAGSPAPTVAATAAAQSFLPQAVGTAPPQSNGSPLPYVALTSPAGGLTDQGEAFTLASAVPIYSIGSNAGEDTAFTFSANTYGFPVATQVGTASSGTDILQTGGVLKHWLYLNGDSSVPCGLNSINSGPTDPTNTYEIQYFVCAGTP